MNTNNSKKSSSLRIENIHANKPNKETKKAIKETLAESKKLKGYTNMNDLITYLSK